MEDEKNLEGGHSLLGCTIQALAWTG